MRFAQLLLLAATTAAITPAAPPLRVMRVTPATPAEPDAEIAIMFDRPVAGGLDATVSADAIFSIEPPVPGRAEWRDPVTLRFVPAQPLEAGRTYTVHVAPSFAAMDGSRLEGEYVHTFRVAHPRVLAGSPVGPAGRGGVPAGEAARYLTPEPRLDVLLSAPADPAALAAAARIVLDPQCGGRTVALRAAGIRQVAESDPHTIRYTGYRGGWPWSPERDLRRVVTLVPAEPLPLDCGGRLSLPQELGAGAGARLAWPFRTYGPPGLADVRCQHAPFCPTGPIRVEFNTPVSGAELARHVRIAPHVPFTVADTSRVSATWVLEASLRPRTPYAVVVDTLLTDVFGQRMRAFGARAMQTTGYAPTVSYTYGRMLVEREGFRTLAVQHVNVDTLVVTMIPVPDSLEGALLSRSWGWEELLAGLRPGATTLTVPVSAGPDARMVTGVRVPARSAGAGVRGGTLVAVEVSSPSLDSISRRHRPLALLQVTDLAVHARVGTDQAEVWVTGVKDGLPREGVTVTLHDPSGAVRARGRTDARGLARLEHFAPQAEPCDDWQCLASDGYVVATTADDRAVVGLNAYDPDLAPWRFDLSAAWDAQRAPQAVAVFTERGIYRPGEPLYAKAIVRRGPLGSLAPARGDSARWVFRDREGGVLADTVVRLGEFGTAHHEFRLPATLPLGQYAVELQLVRDGAWQAAASAAYQVAEYRPPEFLVDVATGEQPRLAGDTAEAGVSARYLFGAPMAKAPVQWYVRRRLVHGWELGIPGADDFTIGDLSGGWLDGGAPEVQVLASAVDTLDEAGRLDLRLPLDAAAGGRPARVSVVATVTDANRQSVSNAASVLVHPAEFYIGARQQGRSWFWTAGQPVSLDVIAVRPDGERVGGVEVSGVIVRREWHRVRRLRGGALQEVGGWVQDTVATCGVRTAAEPVACTFTPPAGGAYIVTLRARDAAGREAVTSFPRWASGSDWVPWNDETQLRMEIIADRERYAPGDTATLLIASPFTDVEAWITIERERVLESRRMRITSGATMLKLPITEAYAPNVFVSAIVVRSRSAPPGGAPPDREGSTARAARSRGTGETRLDDPGRPTMRVGYAELRVTPEVKRLRVDVQPLAPEYRPGDTAAIRIAVRDADGRGQRAEVTLWAVDQGVLALTDYRTPDPIDLIYPPRGVGMRLASNLTNVAAQVPDGEKGKREPGGGGGAELAAILRSRFQSTAFFLGSLVTDENGDAVARAKLPDNLTTFRVMAVAVTAGDRYGSGEADLLVTRPLVVRPALPRFVRQGDRFLAGAVINSRMGGNVRARVEAKADGIALEGHGRRDVRLEGARAAEARFEFRAQPGDSARFTFSARAGGEADAVAVAVPVRPFYHPLSQTIAGLLADTASAEFVLDDDVDPAHSMLEVSFGSSPLAVVAGAGNDLRVYPYQCTEQVASAVLPLIALYRARLEAAGTGAQAVPRPAGAAAAGPPDDPELERMRREIASAVRTLARRQRPDGGIGYWGLDDWTTPWLSAYAGRVLLEARAAGIAVEDSVLARLAGYLRRSLRTPDVHRVAVGYWLDDQANRLAERVAAVDFLSRYGRPDVPAENSLLAGAALLRWEDRLLLAQALARRNELAPARELLRSALAAVRIEGRKAFVEVQEAHAHYFRSTLRPVARLLEALLLVEPQHPVIGPLAETLVDRGRAGASWWNTQDHGHAVLALAAFERARQAAGAPARVRITAGRRTVLDARAGAAAIARDTAITLRGLVTKRADGHTVLPLRLEASGGAPLYYYLTVREAPRSPQLEPVDRGIRVERWYEHPSSGEPVVSVKEGELVRVRLRVTVPAERHFVVLDDPLPAGLEPVDLSLRTVSPFGGWDPTLLEAQDRQAAAQWSWHFGSWDSGVWSAFDHKEMRDDRVIYSAAVLWPGTYTATYLARATTAGTFLYPPAHAEEMYNPAVNGRTAGGRFTVERAQ
jgi:uncharacterized protein YfaS (alpha-2-macroglobulin family)